MSVGVFSKRPRATTWGLISVCIITEPGSSRRSRQSMGLVHDIGSKHFCGLSIVCFCNAQDCSDTTKSGSKQEAVKAVGKPVFSKPWELRRPTSLLLLLDGSGAPCRRQAAGRAQASRPLGHFIFAQCAHPPFRPPPVQQRRAGRRGRTTLILNETRQQRLGRTTSAGALPACSPTHASLHT